MWHLRSERRLMFEAACSVNGFCDLVLNIRVIVASLRMDGCYSNSTAGKSDRLRLFSLDLTSDGWTGLSAEGQQQAARSPLSSSAPPHLKEQIIPY